MTTEEYKEKYNITIDGFNVDYIGTQSGSGPCSAYQHASMLNMYYETDTYDWKDYWNGSTADFDKDLTDVEIFYSDESDYLDEIRKSLDEGIIVGLVVKNNGTTHFVNAIGYELDENGEFTFGGIVVSDSASSDQKVHTIDESDYKLYEYDDDDSNRHGYRVMKPYLVDENNEFIKDENGEKTTNPYYLKPVYFDDEEKEIMPYDLYKYIKSILDIYPSSVSDKAIVKEIILGKTGRHINNDECESIVKAFEDKRIVLGATVTTTVKSVKANVTTASATRYDPLILDLDGDGYNVEKKELGANFDLDKNGFAEKINWTSRDGFLCLDLNGNGAIDNGGELFGDQTLLADGTKAKNGFEALAQYDSSGDGVIDADDEIFDSLRIWVDADGSGTTNEGEMKTLAELGITSINLGYENVNGETGTEATIGNSATFTREDGTTSGIGELWVSVDLFDTVDRLDIEISEEIAALPNVKSIGNVYSLHNAMALDETGELKALVESFASEEDADKRMAIAEQILFFISGANDVEAGSRGAYIDARQLAVIEAMLGEKYVGTTGANPHSDAAPMLKLAYNDLLGIYYNELNAQTHIKDYAALLRYTENEDGTKTLNADLVNFILEYQLENGDENAKKTLTEVARYVQYLDNSGIKGINSFVMNYATISAEYAAEIVKVMPNGYVVDGENPFNGTDNSDFIVGSDNDDEIYGGSGDDILIGGNGNDKLYGGSGNDTYLFNLGDGNDVIKDYYGSYSGSLEDKIIFGRGISADDIRIERSDYNMIIRYSESDSITLIDQYYNDYYRIENFEFADGTKKTIYDYLDAPLTLNGSGTIEDFTYGVGSRDNILIGSDGNDIIYGYDGNDTLIGGKGDDILYGGSGNDTYLFNLGDGNDVIKDYYGSYSGSLEDKIVFGEGISADDIRIERSDYNMIIRYSESDSITLIDQYYNDYYRIENFEFADGTKKTIYDYLDAPLTLNGSGTIEDFTYGVGSRDNILIGSDGNDIIYGYDGNDTLIGGKGDDILYGGSGNDTYLFNLGDGNDVIKDYYGSYSGSLEDKIIFGEGISADDIRIERSDYNMIIRYSESDSITLIDQYYNDYYRIENFEFADGTKKTIYDYLDAPLTLNGSGTIEDFTYGVGSRDNILIGSDGNDSLYGYGGNDILIGGKGDDNLYGGWDDDTYIFNLGDGNDVIKDYVSSYSNSRADKVVFGEGISIENIVFDKQGYDLVISYGSGNDTITIQDQNYNSYYEIESFETSDGYSISSAQVNLLIQSMAAFEADTGMTWAEAAEQPTEEYSDIISQMWVKTA